MAAQARPGQFVALAVGGPPTAMLLRRCFSITTAGDGVLELLIAAAGPGTSWLTRRRAGDVVDLVGPLGRPFPAPAPGAGCVLVGGGYGARRWSGGPGTCSPRGTGSPWSSAPGDASRLAAVDAAGALAVAGARDHGRRRAGRRGRVTDVLAEA